MIPCFLGVMLIAFGSVSLLSATEQKQMAMKNPENVPDIEHPMMKPKMYSKAMRCPNSGMMINMWGRTPHTFHHPEGDLTTCSIRCMADKAVSSEAEPTQAQVALYLDPDPLVPVEDAIYVIGSSAAGTTTRRGT